MAANPQGVNGPRMGQSHGRLRNSMMNQLSKMAGQRKSYPDTVVQRAQQAPQTPSGADVPQATLPLPFQVNIPQRMPAQGIPSGAIPIANATPVLDLSSGTQAINQAAQNLAVLAQLAGSTGSGSGTPNPPAGGGSGGNNGNAGPMPPIPKGLDNVGANQRLARWMLAQRGWGPDQFKFLNFIVAGHGSTPAESNWLGSAHNPAGAYGIGQRYLPAHPWLSKAEEYHYLHSVQYQIAWMLDYIKQRYGTPENAWRYKVAHNNY